METHAIGYPRLRQAHTHMGTAVALVVGRSRCCIPSCLPLPQPLQDLLMFNSIRARKGFTLIELLIVVVIIGILAAIAIPKFANTKSKADGTAMKSDLRNLVTAEEAFFSDSTYYTSATRLVAKNSYKNSSGVGVPAAVTRAGYSHATGPRRQLSGAPCGIRVDTAHPTRSPARDGEPSSYVP